MSYKVLTSVATNGKGFTHSSSQLWMGYVSSFTRDLYLQKTCRIFIYIYTVYSIFYIYTTSSITSTCIISKFGVAINCHRYETAMDWRSCHSWWKPLPLDRWNGNRYVKQGVFILSTQTMHDVSGKSLIYLHCLIPTEMGPTYWF